MRAQTHAQAHTYNRPVSIETHPKSIPKQITIKWFNLYHFTHPLLCLASTTSTQQTGGDWMQCVVDDTIFRAHRVHKHYKRRGDDAIPYSPLSPLNPPTHRCVPVAGAIRRKLFTCETDLGVGVGVGVLVGRQRPRQRWRKRFHRVLFGWD